jgi:ABC-type molybdate transport system ATPase subunit
MIVVGRTERWHHIFSTQSNIKIASLHLDGVTAAQNSLAVVKHERSLDMLITDEGQLFQNLTIRHALKYEVKAELIPVTQITNHDCASIRRF